ncbi:TraB/GumN family protein [Xinfangfangia sp. D13-10-4-6]|nr:TraB/GumN family protein [Pseudogemmobacter hezensis]
MLLGKGIELGAETAGKTRGPGFFRGGVLAFAMALLASLSGPSAVKAQAWFTPGICHPDEIAINRDLLPEAEEARLEALAAQIPNGVGRMWKITAPGGQVSHLWGSYHSPAPAIVDLPDALREVLAQARVVTLEFDPAPKSQDDLGRFYDQAWIWNQTDNVYDERSDFPPEYLDYIRMRLASLGWDPAYLPVMSDAGLLNVLLRDPCDDYLVGFAPGQDNYIAHTAWLAGAKVTGLQDNWAFGEELSDPKRAAEARAGALLYSLYLGPQSAHPGLRGTAYALYRQGRIGFISAWSEAWAIEVLGEARGAETVALADSYLLVERNAIWMGRIAPLADQGGAVFVVGSGHLPGDLGLVTMLRDAGYQVDRVPLPGEAE